MQPGPGLFNKRSSFFDRRLSLGITKYTLFHGISQVKCFLQLFAARCSFGCSRSIVHARATCYATIFDAVRRWFYTATEESPARQAEGGAGGGSSPFKSGGALRNVPNEAREAVLSAGRAPNSRRLTPALKACIPRSDRQKPAFYSPTLGRAPAPTLNKTRHYVKAEGRTGTQWRFA